LTSRGSQAKNEVALLNNIQTNIQGNYKDGRPLHLLPSARSLECVPEASSIFVIEHGDFCSMDPQRIQDIFRHRHILVLGVPREEELSFDEGTLSLFGDIDRPREITGKSSFTLLAFIN
jgi:hypothetical protein